MLRKKLAALLAVTMVITALMAVGTASADPVNSPNAQTFTLVCGTNVVNVVTIENNRAAVVNVVGSTSTFHITSIEETSTATDPQSVQQEVDLTTCTTGALTVTGFFTPQGP